MPALIHHNLMDRADAIQSAENPTADTRAEFIYKSPPDATARVFVKIGECLVKSDPNLGSPLQIRVSESGADVFIDLSGAFITNDAKLMPKAIQPDAAPEVDQAIEQALEAARTATGNTLLVLVSPRQAERLHVAMKIAEEMIKFDSEWGLTDEALSLIGRYGELSKP